MQKGRKKIVVCPSVLPTTCQSKCSICFSEMTILIEYRDQNCKTWYESGYIISGIYPINPDGGTSFEVLLYLDR